MKKFRVLKFWPLLAVFSLLLTFSSCEDPEIPEDDRDQYVAAYQVNETYQVNGTTYQENYTIVITKSDQVESVILLSNFAGYDIIVKANVDGNSFTIPQQTVEGTGFSGSGTINGSTISFSYLQSATDIGIWNVTATATKM